MTATVFNFSPFAHEISSVEAPKGGKFTEDSCINISFLRLPSHMPACIYIYNVWNKGEQIPAFEIQNDVRIDITHGWTICGKYWYRFTQIVGKMDTVPWYYLFI